jgi:transcription elongation GreA/GreB family factor
MSSELDVGPGEGLRMLALTGQCDELEDAWLEALEKDIDPAETLATLEALLKRGENDRVRTLGTMLVAPLVLRGFALEALDAARLIAPLPGEDDLDLPDQIIDACRVIYRDRPEMDGLLRKALVYRREGLAVLLKNIDAMFQFQKGDIVHHKGGWGYGRVDRIRARREELSVVFQGDQKHIFQILSAGEYLRLVSPESFEGLRFTDPDQLRAMAKEDALGLVKLVLADHAGRLAVRVLKDELTPVVLNADAVGPWWTRTRGKLKWDPYLELETKAGGTLRLLEKPETFGESALREFTSFLNFREGLRKVRQYVSESRSHIEEEVLRQMLKRLGSLERPDAPPADKVGYFFLLRRVKDKGFDVEALPSSLEDVVTDMSTFLSALDGLGNVSDQSQLLDFVMERYGEEWPIWFERAYGLGELAVWDRITRALIEAGQGERVERAFGVASAAPKKRPMAFLWFFRTLLAGRFPGFTPNFDRQDLTEKALTLTNKLRTVEEIPAGLSPQKVYQKARDILSEAHFRSLFDTLETPDAKRIIDFISGSGLKRTYAEVIEQICISKFPEIVQRREERDLPDPDVLLVTQDGLSRQQDEYDHLINVDVEANRIALGKAIALGDLSENAELDAAREMQAQLSRKANEMEANLRRAKTIDFPSLTHERIEVGSGAEVIDGEGVRERYLLLGPWEVNPDRGIVSYVAPLGQAFYGRRPGDTFTVKLPVGERTFTVERILRAEDFGVQTD